MSAPVDPATGIIAAVGFVCAAIVLNVAFRWTRRTERRLDAIEASPRTGEEAAASSPDAGPGTFEPALFELRCALSLFDVADAVVRQRSKDGAAVSEGETTGRAYAACSLAGAARRLTAAYVRDTEAGARI